MTFEISLANIIAAFVAVLLAITAYFLKEALTSLKEVQKQQGLIEQRVATIEGRCEVIHSKGPGI